MSETKMLWVKEGYKVFGFDGPNGLNVESLAKSLHKSKSSFYHYFGDMPTFQEALLNYHIDRARQIAKRGKVCENMDPDVINLLIETKTDLMFSKQLRINSHEPQIKQCFDLTFNTITDSYIDKWNAAIGFEQKPMLGKVILHLLVDNFFLQVNHDNLTYQWFHDYMDRVKTVINQVQIAS